MTLEQVEAFLSDYEAVCRKHGLAVHACGCCGSPWVHEIGGPELPSVEGHIEDLKEYAKEEMVE